MKQVLVAFGLMCFSTMAQATVTVFTSSADFHAANPEAALIEDFENSDPALRDTELPAYTGPGGAIAFTAVSAYPYDPNVVLTSPGYTNFGEGLNPTTSIVLTATGNEDFIGTLAAPVSALGFNVLLNDYPLTLSFFSGDALIATLLFDTPPQAGNNYAFGGIVSTEGVTSFRWTATNGLYWNTAIDNIYAGPAGVPEPGTWAMMLLGFGAIGVAMRRQPRPIPQAA